MTLKIQRESLTSPIARALISALNAELLAIYPEPGATHFQLNPDDVSEGHGAFLVAFLEATPRGCGAVRMLTPATAELKRMYVAPAARGLGVGRALLGALEAEARRLGSARMLLETGVRQAAALALYESAGFARIPAFGEYQTSPTSVCMSKAL
jgi:putative acetyltransferase